MSPARRREMVNTEAAECGSAAGCQPLPASNRPKMAIGRGPVPDGRDRPAVPGDPLLRVEADWLGRCGEDRKRVQRLMRVMGLRDLPEAGASRPTPGAKVYPDLLRHAPNQVWAADITYLPMARGFLYLVDHGLEPAGLESNTLEACFSPRRWRNWEA